MWDPPENTTSRLSTAACLLSPILSALPPEPPSPPWSSRSERPAPAVPQHLGRPPGNGAGEFGRYKTQGISSSKNTLPQDMALRSFCPGTKGCPHGAELSGWRRGKGLLGEGRSGFIQGGSAVGPIDQLALGGHDKGEGHAGLAGALGARVRHGHGVHTSSCSFRGRVVGHREWPGGSPGWGGGGLLQVSAV